MSPRHKEVLPILFRLQCSWANTNRSYYITKNLKDDETQTTLNLGERDNKNIPRRSYESNLTEKRCRYFAHMRHTDHFSILQHAECLNINVRKKG